MLGLFNMCYHCAFRVLIIDSEECLLPLLLLYAAWLSATSSEIESHYLLLLGHVWCYRQLQMLCQLQLLCLHRVCWNQLLLRMAIVHLFLVAQVLLQDPSLWIDQGLLRLLLLVSFGLWQDFIFCGYDLIWFLGDQVIISLIGWGGDHWKGWEGWLVDPWFVQKSLLRDLRCHFCNQAFRFRLKGHLNYRPVLEVNDLMY